MQEDKNNNNENDARDDFFPPDEPSYDNILSESDITENYSFDDDEDDFALPGEPEPSDIYEPLPSGEPADVIDEEKEEQRRGRRAFRKKAKLPILITLGVILFGFAAVFSFSLTTIEKDRVMNNIYIEGLDVGGLTYDETLASVNAAYLLADSEITLLSGDKSFSIKGADIGLTALPEETALKAFNYCKSGNVFVDGFNAMRLLFSKHTIVPAPQTDEAKLNEKINEFGNIVLGERKQHYVEFGDDGMVTIYSGKTGYDGDPAAARGEIIGAMNNENFTAIHVSYKSAPPDEMTLESFDALVYKAPVDAKYEINGNEVTVLPSDTGRYINKEEAAAVIPNVHEGCEPIKVPFYVSQPSVTEQTLRDKLFSATLSSYSTSYGGSTSNRCANVARAASLINGTVIAPGGVFSFNDTVGLRTTANGFYTAKEYVNGQSVDGIGGGTCQVSSTLYSAVLYADMTIVERLNHMMSVGYIPLGQDATVSDGGVDFKFKNSSDYPIKISAYTSGATITVKIIGTDWEPHREIKISNSSAVSGKNTIVRSTRYVYANGELISTDTLNSSTYMPHATEPPVKKETKPAAAQPKPDTAPAAEPEQQSAPAEPKPAEDSAETSEDASGTAEAAE